MKLKLGDVSFLFVATILMNVGNYLLNLILGRLLGPEKFAEVSVIATGVLMLSFLAVGVQLTVAKFTSEHYISNESNEVSSFFWWIRKKVCIASIVIGISIIIFSKFIQSYLHFESYLPIIIIGLAIPFYFDMSLKRGLSQGTDRFKALAFTYIGEIILKFTVTFGCIFFAFKYAGHLTTESISVGLFVSFLAAIWLKPNVQKDVGKSPPFENHTLVLQFIGIIIFYEFSQILINNSDVILTEHFFDSTQAGLYSAIALIGIVVFFGTWTIVTLLFPKVIQLEKEGLPHLHLFWKSLAITGGYGLVVILGCLLVPDLIISILFGSEYLSASPLLWKYAMATTLLACANVFAYYYMSLNKYLPVVLPLIAGIALVYIITVLHDSKEQVIYVQITIMSLLFLSMIGFQIIDTLYSKYGQISKSQIAIKSVK